MSTPNSERDSASFSARMRENGLGMKPPLVRP